MFTELLRWVWLHVKFLLLGGKVWSTCWYLETSEGCKGRLLSRSAAHCKRGSNPCGYLLRCGKLLYILRESGTSTMWLPNGTVSAIYAGEGLWKAPDLTRGPESHDV